MRRRDLLYKLAPARTTRMDGADETMSQTSSVFYFHIRYGNASLLLTMFSVYESKHMRGGW